MFVRGRYGTAELNVFFVVERATLPEGTQLVINGFERDEDGEPREIEKLCQPAAGDGVVAVNGISMLVVGGNFNLAFDEMEKAIEDGARPLLFEFARYSDALPDLLYSCLQPAAGIPVSVEILRGLIRRASCDRTSDPLEKSGLRGLAWRVLLGTIGNRPDRWAHEMKMLRNGYAEHAKELLGEEVLAASGNGDVPRERINELLTPDRADVWEAIDRDITRTYLRTPTQHLVSLFCVIESYSTQPTSLLKLFHCIQDENRGRLRRILAVYGFLNRGVGYVQGMNEIAASILEELLINADQVQELERVPAREWFEDPKHSEADAFWLFSMIVQGPARDAFVADNDGSSKAEYEGMSGVAVDTALPSAGGGGLVARLSELERRIRLVSPQLHRLIHLKWGVRAHIYAARWYSVLMRREYWSNEDGTSEWSPQLWDFIFSFTGGHDTMPAGPWGEHHADCLLDICCAFVTVQKKELLEVKLVEPATSC